MIPEVPSNPVFYELLSEKKSHLASVSKSMLAPGLAACSDLPWAGDVGKGCTWV